MPSELLELSPTRTVTKGLIRDFQLAARIAREDSIAVAPYSFVGSRDADFNSRKNAIYVQKVAELEAEKGRKATALQVERIWNDAGIEAMDQYGNGQRSRRSRARAGRGTVTNRNFFKRGLTSCIACL